MEICFNAMRNRAGFSERYREIRSVLKHEKFKEAYKFLDISAMGFKWRVYYFLIKRSMVFPTYAMTRIILTLKNRGIL
jgi:hypothetical protein